MLRSNNHHRWITLIAVATTCLTSLAAADAFGPTAAPAESKEFKVGALTLVSLHDAQFVMPNDGKTFAVDAGAAAATEVLKAHQLPEDRVTLSVNALLVRDGSRLLLIDTGIGAKNNGGLIQSLAQAGVKPAEITDVLITHSHGDHVGGLADAGLAFPKAVIHMSSAEWAWMKSQPASADLVKIIEGHVQTFAPGTAISPGVTALALEGHTPGHVGYEIASGKNRLLDIGDTAHSSIISLEKPDWTVAFDTDSSASKATRKATLARLAKSHELVFSPHFPFPGVGHIIAAGQAFNWVPVTP